MTQYYRLPKACDMLVASEVNSFCKSIAESGFVLISLPASEAYL